MQFILWSQVWIIHEELAILFYTWYKNSISHIYHLSIRAKHASVFRTEPIDGNHYLFHVCMMQSEAALADSGFFLQSWQHSQHPPSQGLT